MNNKVVSRKLDRAAVHIKTINVPGLGTVVFEMRHGDRRHGLGTARIEPSVHVRDGFGIMKGFGARRSVLAYWFDDHGQYRVWNDGPRSGIVVGRRDGTDCVVVAIVESQEYALSTCLCGGSAKYFRGIRAFVAVGVASSATRRFTPKRRATHFGHTWIVIRTRSGSLRTHSVSGDLFV